MFVDTALTGWLLAQVQHFKRTLTVVGEVQQSLPCMLAEPCHAPNGADDAE